ncbi:MAG: hypothetical protein JWP40_1874 [Blastococcus sp.]|jgi:hypothetical protein|nr:hypothetical protein [Blastococcus sp.]
MGLYGNMWGFGDTSWLAPSGEQPRGPEVRPDVGVRSSLAHRHGDPRSAPCASGCVVVPAGDPDGADADVPGHPATDATGAPAPAIAWVNDGQYLAVITYGGSGCPDGSQSIRAVADQEVEVRPGAFFPGSDVCGADLAPYVTVVKLPQGVTPAKLRTARFGRREATLPPASR